MVVKKNDRNDKETTMYDAIGEFLSNPVVRAVLFGAILLVPMLIWAIPEAIKDIREARQSRPARRDRKSSDDYKGVAWG